MLQPGVDVVLVQHFLSAFVTIIPNMSAIEQWECSIAPHG